MAKANIHPADKRIISKIVTVREWNDSITDLNNYIPVKYGYVMPLFHGYEWKRTKRELIRKYTFTNV